MGRRSTLESRLQVFTVYSFLLQVGGHVDSAVGSIKENVGGLVSDQWAADGERRSKTLDLISEGFDAPYKLNLHKLNMHNLNLHADA